MHTYRSKRLACIHERTTSEHVHTCTQTRHYNHSNMHSGFIVKAVCSLV